MIRPLDTQINQTAPRYENQAQQRRQQAQQALHPIARNELNYIPSPESLNTLISNAVQAVRRGQAVERGSILNILV